MRSRSCCARRVRQRPPPRTPPPGGGEHTEYAACCQRTTRRTRPHLPRINSTSAAAWVQSAQHIRCFAGAHDGRGGGNDAARQRVQWRWSAAAFLSIAAIIPPTGAFAYSDAEIRARSSARSSRSCGDGKRRRRRGRRLQRRPHAVLQFRRGARRAAGDQRRAVQSRLDRQGVRLHPAGAGGQAGRGRAR